MTSVRVISNATIRGGGEKSACLIMEMLVQAGARVSFTPATDVGRGFPLPASVEVEPPFASGNQPGPADVLLFYANDFTARISEFRSRWEAYVSCSARRVMCINFHVGKAASAWFRREWHSVGFLNGTMKRRFQDMTGLPDDRFFVLPPPVDIAPFLSLTPDYSAMKIVRVAREFKCPEDILAMAGVVLDALPGFRFHLMGVPGHLRALPAREGVCTYPEHAVEVAEFLGGASAFWYPLPQPWREQGPRVVIEAMAAGLPCVVEARDGPGERVTGKTGWACRDFAEQVTAFSEIARAPGLLEAKGKAAREWARETCRSELWVDAVLGPFRGLAAPGVCR